MFVAISAVSVVVVPAVDSGFDSLSLIGILDEILWELSCVSDFAIFELVVSDFKVETGGVVLPSLLFKNVCVFDDTLSRCVLLLFQKKNE